MYLIAITRWGAPLDQEIGFLSGITGVSAPDLRMHLAYHLPAFLAGGLDEAAAREMMGALLERGHGCVASVATRIPAASKMFSPRSFELSEDCFIAAAADGATLEMPYAELIGIVRATAILDVQTSVEEKQRKLSMGRAVLTGGLMMSKTVTKKRATASVEREPVVYLFRKTGQDHMFLAENRLQYQGLGRHISQTRHQNFNALVNVFRERAPQALFDDRFVSRRPPRLPPSALDGSVEADELDQAAYILVSAHLMKQL
jgi:hypothetical protein